MSLTLRNFQERLMAEGEKHDSGEAQELLRRIEELSSEVHRLKAGLKGDCKSSSSLRIWNETPQRPQDPRPSAVESYRLYKQQLQAIKKQVTYTEHCLNTTTEAGIQ